jgi:hypothetical protein
VLTFAESQLALALLGSLRAGDMSAVEALRRVRPTSVRLDTRACKPPCTPGHSPWSRASARLHALEHRAEESDDDDRKQPERAYHRHCRRRADPHHLLL